MTDSIGNVEFPDCETIFDTVYETKSGFMIGLSLSLHTESGIAITCVRQREGQTTVNRHPSLEHAIDYYGASGEWNLAMAQRLKDVQDENIQTCGDEVTH